MTSRTTLIVIVSSSGLPFSFLNCSKSTFRNSVHLVWVVLSINIKHNHILRQPDRARSSDGCLSRRDEHLCRHSRRIKRLSGEHTRIGRNFGIRHTLYLVTRLWLDLLLVADRKWRFVCICLHWRALEPPVITKQMCNFLFFPLVLKCSIFLHFSLSSFGTIN